MKLRYKVAGGVLLLLLAAIASLALVLSYNAECEPAPPVLYDGTQTARAVVHRCYGSSDILELALIEKPSVQDTEILVKVRAAAVNPLDWHFMRGSPYFMRLMSGLGGPDNIRLGVDFAGTVEAVGSSVTRFKPGDDVFGGANGAFAEYVVAAEDEALAIIPPGVSFEQAAAVPIAAVTALQALRDAGQLQAGERVLINGASGGVGTFAVQIAKSYGAHVTGVCSTRNVEMVRSIGADHVFDYRNEDYTESGQEYDLIIDMVGNHSVAANRRVLKPDGRLVIVGGGKGDWIGPMINPLKAMVVAPFVSQKLTTMLAELRSDDLVVLGDLMQSGEVTPVIDSRYPLSEVPAAIRHSEDGHARGKIIIEVD